MCCGTFYLDPYSELAQGWIFVFDALISAGRQFKFQFGVQTQFSQITSNPICYPKGPRVERSQSVF